MSLKIVRFSIILMDLHVFPILTFLSVALVVSHATPPRPPEIYWKKMLPNTVMPRAIKLSLPESEMMEDQSTRINNTEDYGGHLHHRRRHGVQHHHRHHDGGEAHVNVDPINGVGVHTRHHGGGHTDVDVNQVNGVRVHTGKSGRGKADVDVGWGGVTVNAGRENRPVYVVVHPGINPFDYRYSHTMNQSKHDPSRSLFFLKKDMKYGHSMKLHFTKSTNSATFLPREKAKSLPFSSNKISTILREFSVDPNSEQAKIIEETIKGCKLKGISGEQKYCATSLESLIDYAKNTLGKNVNAMSTEAKIIEEKVQNFTIEWMKKVAGDNDVVVCHKQKYAYAVFYCHKSKGTSAHMVSLMNAKGSKAKALAVCHKDTSAWNPKHLAFQILNVKPGSVPICHFLPEDHIIWVSDKSSISRQLD